MVENPATGAGLGFLRCLPVLADQPGEPGPALDPGGRDGEGDEVRVVVRCPQAHALALVAAAGVVVADVLGQDRPQVLLAGDEHPVGALGTGRADEALGTVTCSNGMREPGAKLTPDTASLDSPAPSATGGGSRIGFPKLSCQRSPNARPSLPPKSRNRSPPGS